MHALLIAAMGALLARATVDADAPASPQITAAPAPEALDDLIKRQAAGAPGTPILSTLTFPFTALPNQVYPFPVLRGPQFGFNVCNSTTLGPQSDCQTLIFNGPDDFCLWGSPEANGSIGNDEAKVVAYCTKPTHGTRLIPPGAITGLQWTRTSAYIQAVGFIDNSALSLTPDDSGGELDPHGADLQGNPLGGVVYSNGTADSDGHTLTQVLNWNTFVGSGQFCFKACFNSQTSPDYCLNTYDLIGCDYNMPTAVQNGTFTSCEGELQDVVGVYTTNGQVVTYSMPPTFVQPPYTPRIPASSSCTTFQSNDLFLAAPSSTAASSAPAGPVTPAPGSSGTGTGAATAPGSSAGSSGPKPTGTSGTLSVKASLINVFVAGAALYAFAM